MTKLITLLCLTLVGAGLLTVIPSTESPAAIAAIIEPGTEPTTPVAVTAAAPVPPHVTIAGDVAPAPAFTGADYPVRLSLPAIGLSDAIIKVGLNAEGEMAVPSGNSSNVGWYKDGTLPGEVGSAVLDAH